jgi:vacuolar-type H+-ATPase subunit E/Vma4
MKMMESRVKRLYNHSDFRMEALESALIEAKLQLRTERERYAMQVAEHESALLNAVPDKRYVDDLISQIDNGLVLHNTQEARIIVNRLHKIIKGYHNQQG